MTLNQKKYFEEICKQLEEDFDKPICQELIQQFEEHPECQKYFESVQKVIELYKKCQPSAQLTPEMKNKILKKFQRFLYVHIQHIGNIFPSVTNLQCFPVITLTFTLIAYHIHIRQKMHFNFPRALALTGFAAAPFDVEAETPRRIAPDLGFSRLTE